MTTPSSLQLTNQCQIESALSPLNLSLSDYSFPNLYLFRDKHSYQLCPLPASAAPSLCCISGITYDNRRFLMPLFNPALLSLSEREWLFQQLHTVDFLYPIDESWLSFFPDTLFKTEVQQADSDYLYTRTKLEGYPGKKLHSKRNLYKQFCENYHIEALPLSDPAAQEGAIAVLTEWQTAANLPIEAADTLPCMEALRKVDSLHLLGFLFLADGEPAGFTLGEQLHSSHYALHFAKGLRQFKGIYQYLFSQTAALLPPEIEWINLEQDLGDPGLRATKQSYQPDKMLHKYRISYR